MAEFDELFPEFVANIALLVVLCYVTGLVARALRSQPEERMPAINGILFGLTAIAGMHLPMTLAEGIYFDGRNIIVMLAAPYGGFAAGVIAAAMAGAFRLWEGGVGAAAGCGAIVTAAVIGIAFRARYSRPPARIRLMELLALSMVVTASSLAWTFALPASVDAVENFESFLVPILLVHPVATVFVGAILTDMYRRLELVDRLRQSESRLVAAQHLARLGDFVWHVPSGQVTWSDGLYELLGYDRTLKTDVTFMWETLHHPEDREHVNEWFRNGMREAKTDLGRHTYRVFRADGTILHILVSVRFEWRGNRVENAHGTCHDITELVQSLDSLAMAKEEAERANQAKSDFLAAMSHELRTPLNAIIGFSDILRLQSLGPDKTEKYREYAGDINSSALHLLGLVEKILDLSAIEAGHYKIDIELLNLNQIVAEALKLVEDKAWSRSILLISDVDPGCREVRSDRSSLLQMLLNLLGNALKFTPIGGTVTVVTKQHGERFVISVVDTGIGIDPADLPQLTDYFTRATDNPYLAEKGWGLGLGITRSLVELLGGKLTIESQPGQGTTVTVMVPQETADEASVATDGQGKAVQFKGRE